MANRDTARKCDSVSRTVRAGCSKRRFRHQTERSGL